MFKNGDEVSAKCRNGTGGFFRIWFPATIKKKNDDGTYHVDYDEDSDEDFELGGQYIRKRQP